jgi:hypothetical protein
VSGGALGARILAAVAAASLLAAGTATGADRRKEEAGAVEREHPSGAFTYRVPAAWTVGPSPNEATDLELAGDGLRARIQFKAQEMGFDGLHSLCMLDRLAGPMAMDPRVQYEYDFVSGQTGDRRFLDSAFFVGYEPAIQGHRVWRQRTLTVVGEGQSLCISTFAPADVWKKSRKVRETLDAIVASITFR